VEHGSPDRVPNGCYALPSSYIRYGGKLEELFQRYPSDFHQFVTSWATVASDSIPYRGGINRDPWGVIWRNLNPGIFGRVSEYPLANLEKLDGYEPPDPSQLVDFGEVESSIRLSGHDRYVLGDSENFFERLHFLHGFEATLIDLIRGKSELARLIDLLFDFKVSFIKRWLELDIDGLYFLDDWGTMQGLMINPALWRRIFKPLYREMFETVHRSGKHVFFHSDGYVLDIVPDLIEIGVDALNVQVKLIGIDLLGERFSGRLCILADVDRQRILPFGSTEEVEEHVRHIIRALGSNGGGLVSWGEVGPDVPLLNVEAMLAAFERYGKY
jgi:uroporphyrinogen decarboxylase